MVVASDIDGYRDAAGADAVLVPPGDRFALAEALESALAPGEAGGAGAALDPRPDRLAAASARAEGWSMKRLVERYETLYWSVTVRPTR